MLFFAHTKRLGHLTSIQKETTIKAGDMAPCSSHCVYGLGTFQK